MSQTGIRKFGQSEIQHLALLDRDRLKKSDSQSENKLFLTARETIEHY